jgi:hypothetical protein
MLALRASMLIQNGLKGEYVAPIIKMLLTKHKGEDGLPYADKSDITSGGQPINPMADASSLPSNTSEVHTRTCRPYQRMHLRSNRS